MVIEDSSSHGEQLSDERVADEIAYARAFFTSGDDVSCPQDGELLRHDGLIDFQNVLELLHAPLALQQHLKDLDPDGVRESAEEFRFEALELAYYRIHIK